jgi:YD repeat-containing protein
MRLITSILLLLTVSAPSAHAIVDMKNANYAHTWTDCEVPGTGYDLKCERTYNSRSLFNGIFGFGWCSPWESKIEVTAENFIRLTECGAGLQLTYKPKRFDKDAVSKTIGKIMEEVRKRNKGKPAKFFANLEKDIREDEILRQQFEKKLKMSGKVKDGIVYIVDGRDNETIVLKNGRYVRTLADGTKERYSTNGTLDAKYDRNGNYLKFDYQKGLLTAVTDNKGRKLTIKTSPLTKKIEQIVGPNGLKVTYKHKGEDLESVKNSWGNTYTYDYDDLHNVTKIVFPDKTTRELKYNKDKDWVIGFKNRKNCNETYNYQTDPKDPINHYWSTVLKKCGKKVTNKSRYEFWHRNKVDGTGKFLYRVRSDVNGDITDIVYHQIFGKPISIVRNNNVVRYEYHNDGRVRLKNEPLRRMKFSYKNQCNKVSEVSIDYLAPLTPAEKKKAKVGRSKASTQPKVIRTVTTQFLYEKQKCNLVYAQNSMGQTARLKYDSKGRISTIKDQSKKIVNIKYEAKFGKPFIVTRPGLGTIKVLYDEDGSVKSVKSKDGPQVAVQVASIFNNLLDIIAPATSETPL